MRWLRRIGLVLLVVIVVLIAWEPSRVAIQTAVMLPNLLDAGPKPLNLFSEAPVRSAVPYRTVGSEEEPELAELWLPAWATSERRAGAMLLVLGVNNVGRNHPAVERVADGLARTGVAVLVPDSRVLLEGRLELGEVDGVVRAFQLLAARPEVDPGRLGIVGFSVGGSLALLAAGDPRIADEVRWVNAFGAFADAETYLAAASAHAYRGPDGSEVPWTPSALAREIYLQFMLDIVRDTDDREALDAAFRSDIIDGERPSPDAALRDSLETDTAQTIHDLLTAGSLDRATAAIDGLPRRARSFIDAISPLGQVDAIRSDVHLMHETEDHHVPFVESRALAAALEDAGILAVHTEFRLFDHVQPDDLDLIAAAPELLKLLLHVRGLMEETL
jgi:dienelactone hydrolase